MSIYPHVKLWEIYPNGRRRLMNTIDETSQFRSIKGKKDPVEIAKDLAQGWRSNGPRPDSRYEMEHFISHNQVEVTRL